MHFSRAGVLLLALFLLSIPLTLPLSLSAEPIDRELLDDSIDVGGAIRWAKSCQQSDGGFGYTPSSDSSYEATTLALTVLERLDSEPDDTLGVIRWVRARQSSNGGFGPISRTRQWLDLLSRLDSVPSDTSACIDYLSNCQNGDGGFAQTPGARTNTTPPGALGTVTDALHCFSILGASPTDPSGCRDWLLELQATDGSFESIGVADAVISALYTYFDYYPRDKDGCVEWVGDQQNPDGGFGPEGRDTPAAERILQRLGGKPDDEGKLKGWWESKGDKDENYAKTQAKLQKDDGGFGAAGKPSGLNFTSQVVSSFVGAKFDEWDEEACLDFVGSCQNDDGGFGERPGEEPNLVYLSHALSIFSGVATIQEMFPPEPEAFLISSRSAATLTFLFALVFFPAFTFYLTRSRREEEVIEKEEEKPPPLLGILKEEPPPRRPPPPKPKRVIVLPLTGEKGTVLTRVSSLDELIDAINVLKPEDIHWHILGDDIQSWLLRVTGDAELVKNVDRLKAYGPREAVARLRILLSRKKGIA